MKISARNVLKGKVKRITHGAVDAEVVVELASGLEMVAVITQQSADSLKLAAGSSVYAIVKASNVLIGID